MAKPKELTTVAEVITELGGPPSVKTMTGSKSLQVVNNWKTLDRFASRTYLVLTAELEKRGFTARPELWGIEGTNGLPSPESRAHNQNSH